MVSLEKYKCFCPDVVGLELFTSQKDVQYIKCKTSNCGFFTSANDFGSYLQVIDEKVHKDFKKKAPLCNQHVTATMWVSKSEKNPGRPFFKCGERDESCGYFQWGDLSPTRKTYENWKPPMVDKSTMTDPLLPSVKVKRRKNTKEDAVTS